MPAPPKTSVKTAIPTEVGVGSISVIGIRPVSVRSPAIGVAIRGITIPVRYGLTVSGVYGAASNAEIKSQESH
jgi:hypothetical protein